MADISNKKEEQNEKLSPEELKHKQDMFLKEFMAKNTKELKVPSISKKFKEEVSILIKDIEKINVEIEEKRIAFVKQYKNVKSKLNTLTKEGQITLNEDDFKKSQESFARYENYLHQVLGELSGDMAFYSNLIGENASKTIKVFKNSTDDSTLYLNEKLKVSKKSIKKILKDVRVSYSRYFVGLGEQVRKLDYLSSYLKSSKNKK